MNDQIVLLDVQNGIATLTLNRPEVHNAFDEHVIAQLSGKFDMLAREEGIRVLILRGAGKNFSAGGDMNWMKRAGQASEDDNRRDALGLATMLNKLYTLPFLTIAMVQGAAMGGGMGLACCCDIVIAGPHAKFALSEVKIGLIPATIGPYVMAALGPRQCRRYFQTGERIGALQAHQIGLVHELADDETAMEEALSAILDNVKTNGPQAMRKAKALAGDLTGKAITPELLDDTAERIAAIRATDEAREGLSAFLEKRKPRWQE